MFDIGIPLFYSTLRYLPYGFSYIWNLFCFATTVHQNCYEMTMVSMDPVVQARQAERHDQRHLAAQRQAVGRQVHEGSSHRLRRYVCRYRYRERRGADIEPAFRAGLGIRTFFAGLKLFLNSYLQNLKMSFFRT